MVRRLVLSALPLAILLLGLALRLIPWGESRFLEDEALYAYWGLQIASGTDPMLDHEPVDKPPLYPYALALSLSLAGAARQTGAIEAMHRAESAARLPSLLASTAGLALVYGLGRNLPAAGGHTRTERRVAQEAGALLALLLLALSPFDILFASTAFTDPLMTTLALGALLSAVRGHPTLAGLLLGLAVATKQQALLFLPLVAGWCYLAPDRSREPEKAGSSVARLRRIWGLRGVRFLLGFALIVGGVVWWDLARVQRPGILEQSLLSYGGLHLAPGDALPARAGGWLYLLGQFWASRALSGLFLASVAGWLALGSTLGPARGPRWVDLTLLAFAVAYLALHWLVDFQLWDRYLLCLVPLAALLAARALVGLGVALRRGLWRRLAAAGLILTLFATLVRPVTLAARSELPVGGDHGAYDGIDRLAETIRSQAPAGAVLYHEWLGNHYRFYLYAAPLRLHWYPDSRDLARDAVIYRRVARYIAFPSWRDSEAVETALASEGIRLIPVSETTRRDGTVSFRLYRLEGPGV